MAARKRGSPPPVHSMAPMQFIKSHWISIASFVWTAGFFAIYLAVFRPGYAVSDDISLISLVSGYLGTTPVPFMTFSNVLLGFVLIPLYAMHSNLNWEIWLLITVNFLSVWVLVHLVLLHPLRLAYKITGILVLLACDSYLLMRITYTSIAAFAAVAGFCAVLTAARAPIPSKRLLIFGSLLILASSLLRPESLLLVSLVILPCLLIMGRFFRIQVLASTVAITATLVAGCYAFDRIYVRSYPAWDSFYAYVNLQRKVIDTPRVDKRNILNFLSGVGWSRNDFWLFTDYSFLDPTIYSAAKLQYLADHVSGTLPSLSSAFREPYNFQRDLQGSDSIPYVLIMAATWSLALLHRHLRKAVPALAALLASASTLCLYLVWSARVPLHVWVSFLATTSVFGIYVVGFYTGVAEPTSRTEEENVGLSRLAAAIVLVMACASVVTALYRASLMTRNNVEKQVIYHEIVADLDALQAQGKIAPNALILSPNVGIPMEWSDPLIVDLPGPRYFQVQWLAFSPLYDEVLRDHGAQSLPTDLYRKGNLYLMTPPALMPAVVQFMKEHRGVTVYAKRVYSLGDQLGVFSKVTVYRLTLQE